MRKTIFIAITMATVSISTQAQSFEEVLSKTLDTFQRTDTLDQKLNATNRLDLIALRYRDQWAAFYYVAYAKIVTSYLLKDESKKDAWLDQAERALEQATTLYGKPWDELSTLKAYLSNARLVVGNRWKKFGPIFEANLEEAKKLNPDNPRIYFLKGQSLFYTPKAFGGGAKKALPYFEKASLLFQNDSRADILKPHWGEKENTYYLEKCKE